MISRAIPPAMPAEIAVGASIVGTSEPEPQSAGAAGKYGPGSWHAPMRPSGRRGNVAVEVIDMSSSIVTRVPHVPLPRRVRRHPQARVWRPWLVAWLGASVLGIVNGGVREVAYADRLGETAAGHVSVATLIALIALYVAALDRRWPLPSRRTALGVGAAWAGVTVAFEFAFGHWVAGDSWAELAGQYDVLAGRTWVLVLAWIAVAPAIVRALRLRSGGDA